ncbi:T9SS type A sorting domain-containing protein [candidate division WOR-3 bacterium]|nr:T9SS type A sorting domain-containing protein [candidate division WOR-3 bacterium]
MFKKLTILSVIIGVFIFSVVYSQVIPNDEFESNLESWYGMFDAWFSDPGNVGDLTWSSSYGGSAYLHVNGAPEVMGIWTHTQDSINPGDSIYTRITHSNYGNFAGLVLRIGGLSPYGQEVVLPKPAGTDDIAIIADRTYPAGSPVWIKFAVWPGEAEAYVWYVKTNAAAVEEDSESPISKNTFIVIPNPSTLGALVSFTLKQRDDVTLEIYDNAGRKVRSLFSGSLEAGKQNILWDSKDENGKNVANGIYFFIFKTGVHTETKKATVVK